MYSFGYIVPFVSAYLIWTRRRELAELPASPARWPGFAVLAVALVLLMAGRFAGIQVAEQFAFLAALVGVVLLVFGLPALRTTWVALAYLLLMVPFWDAFTEPLHLPFQQLSARLGVKMLHVIGVPAHNENVTLFLPNITLEVARACSGVNYVVAVLALGIPLGYLYLPNLWRRVVLILTAVAIAAVSNSLRVALIGVLAYWNIGSPLHGPFHVLHGLFVSGVGYVVLFAGLRVLTPGGRTSTPTTAATIAVPTRPAWRSFRLVTVALLIGLFVAAGGVLSAVDETPAVPLPRPLELLPARLGPWTSGLAPGPIGNWYAGADDSLRRRYSGEGLEVDLSVEYFASQRQGKELVSHRGDVLHRAATPVRLSLSGGGTADVNATAFRSDGRDLLGIFWYEIDGRIVSGKYRAKWLTLWSGRIVSGKYRAKWLTLWSAIVHRRSNGAVVVLLVDRERLRDGRDDERLQQLAVLVHEALARLREPGA